MKYAYGNEASISKKNILLSNKDAKMIEKASQVKMNTKIFRIFQARKNKTFLGYGILVNRKVRSKNAVVLYLISKNGFLKSIEVIAFNEPMEYFPSKLWSAQFKDINTTTMLRTSKEIPTITGATLSARAITSGSRLAFSIYNHLLKDK
ncbi:FMN-binding protein [Sulfurimonas sp.]